MVGILPLLLLSALLVFACIVYQHMRKYPDLGFYVAVINTVLVPFRIFRLGIFRDGDKVNLDVAMKIAMKETGLNDFGDLSFATNYRLAQNLESYKALEYSNFGFMSAQMELVQMLSRRLRKVDYLKRYPEILNIKIESPIFVFGIGRSGTTFVHRLLSLHPSARAPLLWEHMSPVPNIPPSSPLNDHLKDAKLRRDIMKKRLDQRLFLGMKTIEPFHEIGVDLPEECLFAMNDEVPISTAFVYSIALDYDNYMGAINKDAIVRAYQGYKQHLQILASQRPGENKQWVLKCPLHILWLPQLLQVFPDAKIVWAHRHPFPTVSSQCSLLRAMHELYFTKDCLNQEGSGEGVMKYCDRTIQPALDQIKDNKWTCAHVNFNELTKTPLEAVKRVYKELDLEFTPSYEQCIKDYLVADEIKRKKQFDKAKNNYYTIHSPASFGLDEKKVSERFAQYSKQMNFSASK